MSSVCRAFSMQISALMMLRFVSLHSVMSSVLLYCELHSSVFLLFRFCCCYIFPAHPNFLLFFLAASVLSPVSCFLYFSLFPFFFVSLVLVCPLCSSLVGYPPLSCDLAFYQWLWEHSLRAIQRLLNSSLSVLKSFPLPEVHAFPAHNQSALSGFHAATADTISDDDEHDDSDTLLVCFCFLHYRFRSIFCSFLFLCSALFAPLVSFSLLVFSCLSLCFAQTWTSVHARLTDFVQGPYLTVLSCSLCILTA